MKVKNFKFTLGITIGIGVWSIFGFIFPDSLKPWSLFFSIITYWLLKVIWGDIELS